MSVRSETRDLSANMQQALTISPEVMRTAAQESGAIVPVDTAGQADHLNPANEFNTSNPEHPLKRTVVVNIRASLNDLCLKKARATWQPPNVDATKAIFQQRKFVDLQGTSEAQGNLKSIVLHKMSLTSQRNTFPIGEKKLPSPHETAPHCPALRSQRWASASPVSTTPPSRRRARRTPPSRCPTSTTTRHA